MTRREFTFAIVAAICAGLIVVNFFSVDFLPRVENEVVRIEKKKDEEPYQNGVIRILKTQEGFKGNPYKDGAGKLTIGYGTMLPLDKEESELLLVHRLSKAERDLAKRWPQFLDEPSHIKQALALMAYQLGVSGELQFTKMLAALKENNIKEAIRQIHNSKWEHQTPIRTATVAALMER